MVKWFQKAAVQGLAKAQFSLGAMYSTGRGVLEDDKEAVKWFQKAAVQGNADAQFSLGAMYANGEGVEQDFKEAVKWYQKSADHGNAAGQCYLGLMYLRGQGVLEDYVTAYAWFNISAANGYSNGKKLKDAIAGPMTPDQIAEAQKLSRELLRKIEANKAGKPKPSDSPFGRPLIDPDTGLPVIERR
jgi:TPR repeat protein